MEIKADLEIYKDGSTSGNKMNKGAGFHIRSKGGSTIEEMDVAAGKYCSSYDGEGIAMIKAFIGFSTEEIPTNT